MRFGFMKILVKLIARTYFRLQVHNVDRVPRGGGLVLISNHSSNIDPPIVGARLSRPMYTLAKAELFKNAIVGHFLGKWCYAIPFRRRGVDRAGMQHCVALLKAGQIVSLFPEGTRTRDGQLQRGKPGVAMLALQAGVPCVPAYIDGTYAAMPRGGRLPRPKKVRIYYGEPFRLPERAEGMTKKEYYQHCADEMMRRITALRPE